LYIVLLKVYTDLRTMMYCCIFTCSSGATYSQRCQTSATGIIWSDQTEGRCNKSTISVRSTVCQRTPWSVTAAVNQTPSQ